MLCWCYKRELLLYKHNEWTVSLEKSPKSSIRHGTCTDKIKPANDEYRPGKLNLSFI